MPKIEIDIEVWCDECGAGICHLAADAGKSRPGIAVGICEKCKKGIEKDAYDSGFEDGETQGYAKAIKENT